MIIVSCSKTLIISIHNYLVIHLAEGASQALVKTQATACSMIFFTSLPTARANGSHLRVCLKVTSGLCCKFVCTCDP